MHRARGGHVSFVWLMLAIISGSPDSTEAQGRVRSVLRPWPDTSATQSRIQLGVRAPGARGFAEIKAWEVLESDDPRWWTDPASLPRASSLVLGEFLQVPLGLPWLEWRRQRDVPRTGCVVFQGATGHDYEFMDRSQYWVYRCASSKFGGTLEFYAYLLGDSEQLTLERVRWTARPEPGLSGSALKGARAGLAAVLAARPEFRQGILREPQEWSDPYLIEGWEMFAAPLGHVRLGFARDEDARNSDSLLVLDLWSRDLLADEAAAAAAAYREESPGARFRRMRLPPGTQAALGARWPGLAHALSRSARSLDDLPKIRGAVEAVRALKGKPQERSLVLFAATQWVFAFDDTSDTTAVRRIEAALGPVGLKGDWGHYDGLWHPSPSLLLEAIPSAGSDPWADRAFLHFQEIGWEGALVDSLERFRIVIARGEPFLRDHARSASWAGVARTVARAHETAWSLSKASVQDEYVDWTLYAREAPEHRARAIELYEAILRRWQEQPPGSRDRSDVRRRLARLRLDVDTGSRTYYPISC